MADITRYLRGGHGATVPGSCRDVARSVSARGAATRARVLAARALVASLLALLLAACAPMRPGYEQPTVTLKSFRALPSSGALPSFEIGLGVVNPNREPLEVVGVAYTVRVGGHDLVKGVGKDFDVIEGYATGELKLIAEANLIQGMRLVASLMAESPERLDYELEAKLDLGVFRAVRVSERGQLDLGNRGVGADR